VLSESLETLKAQKRPNVSSESLETLEDCFFWLLLLLLLLALRMRSPLHQPGSADNESAQNP
jgi:hypothetical protein